MIDGNNIYKSPIVLAFRYLETQARKQYNQEQVMKQK